MSPMGAADESNWAFEVFVDHQDLARWRLVALHDRVIADSAGFFPSLEEAIADAELVREQTQGASVRILPD